jgi:aspartate/methionine/tyrosine aminotransferase
VVLSVLPDFRLEVYLGRWEFAAEHHLTASDAQTLTVAEVLGPDGMEELARLPLSYTPTWGTDALREAIADTYDVVTPDDVLVFAGAEEAMFWAMQELVGPGGHAVVTVPNYQSMESVTLATGAAVSGLALDPASGWALDLDALRALLRPDTRLVAVNFPNNPTGALPDPATWEALVELCEERGVRLFSDEVYRGLEPEGTAPLAQAADRSPGAISMGVLSKAYGLPGLRIGWLACRDRAVLERLENRKHYTSICNAAPSELIATAALRRGDEIKARNRALVAANLPVFDAFFARWEERFAWEHPQAGCVCFPRYLGADGVDAFCIALVEQAGVVLLPASIYRSELGPVPADRFRIDEDEVLGSRGPLRARPRVDARRHRRALRALASARALRPGSVRELRAHAPRDGRAVRRHLRWRLERQPGRVLARGRRVLRRRPAARRRARRAGRRAGERDRAGDPRSRAGPGRPAARPGGRRGARLPAARGAARLVPPRGRARRRRRSRRRARVLRGRHPDRRAADRHACGLAQRAEPARGR